MLMFIPALEARPIKSHTPAPTTYSRNLRQQSDLHRPELDGVIQGNLRHSLTATLQAIFGLRERTSGWDGYNAPAPNPHALAAALHYTQELFAQVNRTRAGWREPRVSSDESGNITLEWRRGTRSLELFVTPHTVEYLKVWGPDILSEMSDGDITRPHEILALWNWLHA